MNDFNAEFASAAKALGVTPEKIVSLKIRDNVSSYNEYRDLIHSLEREFGFQCSPVTGELQGRGHLLTKEKSKVIVVEHETGLEILYIAGSIASLIALIPIIMQGWSGLRQFANPKNPFNVVEVRRLDESGNLQEHPTHNFQLHGVADASNLALTTASLLEEEFQKVNGQIEWLLPRIAALEKRLTDVEGTLKNARPAKRSKKK
jgi:hypothetical protein